MSATKRRQRRGATALVAALALLAGEEPVTSARDARCWYPGDSVVLVVIATVPAGPSGARGSLRIASRASTAMPRAPDAAPTAFTSPWQPRTVVDDRDQPCRHRRGRDDGRGVRARLVRAPEQHAPRTGTGRMTRIYIAGPTRGYPDHNAGVPADKSVTVTVSATVKVVGLPKRRPVEGAITTSEMMTRCVVECDNCCCHPATTVNAHEGRASQFSCSPPYKKGPAVLAGPFSCRHLRPLPGVGVRGLS